MGREWCDQRTLCSCDGIGVSSLSACGSHGMKGWWEAKHVGHHLLLSMGWWWCALSMDSSMIDEGMVVVRALSMDSILGCALSMVIHD
eukprot:EC796422.1.p1 GENE.EC796422.1~~EC796422.1.p1  ORF type:complete len:88 (+),score=9.12 EC796422.1:152-415(+)